VLLLGLCYWFGGGAITYVDYSEARTALATHHFSIVEGRVANFAPASANGRRNESFIVNGKKFSYSQYVLTAGFNTVSAEGGPIHEGAYVRVSYVGDEILRLEVGH
jgi:hypothetical protein